MNALSLDATLYYCIPMPGSTQPHWKSNSLNAQTRPLAICITHSFNFPVCVMILVYACGAFTGQEGEEAVDEDNYWESYHPQNRMVFSPTSIYSAAYLTVTPGRTSCTLADGNAFPNMVVKCNYSQTPQGRGNQNFWLHKTKEVHSKVYARVIWRISSFNGWQYSC